MHFPAKDSSGRIGLGIVRALFPGSLAGDFRVRAATRATKSFSRGLQPRIQSNVPVAANRAAWLKRLLKEREYHGQCRRRRIAVG
jgi:hypothetical protein